jgi:hypothetical protein
MKKLMERLKMDARICPNCNSRDAYKISATIGEEIRGCEN